MRINEVKGFRLLEEGHGRESENMSDESVNVVSTSTESRGREDQENTDFISFNNIQIVLPEQQRT
eukprot:911910-Karenia_brevis.AAC.1